MGSDVNMSTQTSLPKFIVTAAPQQNRPSPDWNPDELTAVIVKLRDAQNSQRARFETAAEELVEHG